MACFATASFSMSTSSRSRFFPELLFALSIRAMTVFLFSDSDDNFMIPSRAIDRLDRSYLLCEIV